MAFCASFWRIGEARVLHRHREPDPSLSAGVVDDLDALAGLGRQDLGERRMIGRFRHDDRRRHRPLDVVLLEEGRNDLGQLGRIRMLRKERAIADMSAAADHHDVDGDESLLRHDGDDVDVARRRALHELPGLELRETRDLVADARRALERERRCGLVHLDLELGQHQVRLALQEEHRALDVLAIVRFGNQPDARTAAALDLVQHAGPRAVREHRVLAGADLEDLLQERHALADRAGARIRTEVAVLPVEPAAMEAELRKRIGGQADVRIALVVAKDDVVARFFRFDQVVLEEQRFPLGAGHRRLDPRNLREHHGDPSLVRALLEIARDALLQVARLADVERRAAGIEHPVHAGTMRQRRDQLARVEGGRRRGYRFRAVHVRRPGARPACRDAPRSRRTRRGTSAR